MRAAAESWCSKRCPRVGSRELDCVQFRWRTRIRSRLPTDRPLSLPEPVALTPAHLAEVQRHAQCQGLIAKVARKQLLATAANAKKREWRERAERAEHLAAQRLEKLKSFKEVDECDDEMVIDASTAQLHADAYAKLQSMPKWQRTSRGKGGGKGGKKLEDEHRVTIYSMFANQTPLSAISSNIIAVVKQAATWRDDDERPPSRLGP